MNAMHVLLVEDNEGDVRLTQEAFRDRPILSKLSVARTGQEALDFVFREGEYSEAPRPDLILLDVNLPRISGGEVLQSLKQDNRSRDIPVIMLTTASLVADIGHKFEQLAQGYVAKPLDVDEFLATLQSLDLG